jgi:hypothetical protein
MRLAVAIFMGLMLAAAAGFQGPNLQPAPTRFEAVDVFVDSGQNPLAAWQVQVKAVGGSAKLVGIEGGESVYKDPPYYDPAALQESQVQERVVLAAFSTNAGLPTGKTRVARLHLQARGNAEYVVTLMTAAGADGSKIQAKATAQPATGDGR